MTKTWMDLKTDTWGFHVPDTGYLIAWSSTLLYHRDAVKLHYTHTGVFCMLQAKQIINCTDVSEGREESVVWLLGTITISWEKITMHGRKTK